jgi:THO complex subunit 2
VLRGYYLSALDLASHGDGALNPQLHVIGNPHLHLKEARLRVEDALGACLLPSLQLVPANPAVGQEIWELMSLLPYEVFFCICCLSFYLIYCCLFIYKVS